MVNDLSARGAFSAEGNFLQPLGLQFSALEQSHWGFCEVHFH